MTDFVRRTVASPVGPLTLVSHATHLVALLWPEDADGCRVRGMAAREETGSHPVLDRAEEQLTEYFAGARTSFELPLAPAGTPFQLAAWDELRRIPFASTRTYTQQAAAVGRPAAVRAIGAANGRNPISIIVPCHRVVAATGKLQGFAGGLGRKQALLDLERRVAARLTPQPGA